MRRELVGITLAVSIGLSACAYGASPAFVTGLADASVPLDVLQAMPLVPAEPDEANELSSLAMAGSDESTDGLLLALAQPKKSTAGSAALNAGVSNYKRGFIAKAIPLFEQAARQNPQSEQAFLWLARAHQKQGTAKDQERAKLAYQKVLAIDPNNVEALSNLGEMWSWDAGQRAEAISLLQRAYQLEPKDKSISKKLAEALLWQGNPTEALRYAAPIADQYRSDKKFMGEYAQMLSASGHADEAVTIYETTLQNETEKHVDLQIQQARALLKSGQTAQAQGLYEEIAARVTNTKKMQEPEFVDSMASLAFDMGLYGEALKWDAAQPDSARRKKSVQLREARALTKVYRVPEAIDTFHRLYQAGLLSADEKLEYAEYLRMLHLEPSAMPAPNLLEQLYQEVTNEAPENPDVALRLARYNAEQEDRFAETVQAYQKALSNPYLKNRAVAQKELLDYLKTDKAHSAEVEALFHQLLADSPGDANVQTAYAEYLSWQPDRRAEALRMYVELGKADPANHELWQGRIEEVLKWHEPTTAMIPVYQEIVNLYPQNKTIWLTVARAYRSNKDYYKEAVETYSTLVKSHPDDGTIKREWLSMLMSNKKERGENLRLLKKMASENPADLDIVATYGKLLSYEHKYGAAMDAFDQVLRQNPGHRDALVGKGYVILWSGRKLEAKEFFQDLRNRYPDDVDIAIGLAQSEKLIGRYDQALKIIEEIKPLMDKAGDRPQQSGLLDSVNAEFRLVANEQAGTSLDRLTEHAVYDFSIAPASTTTDAVARPPLEIANADAGEVQALRSEIEALSDAVNALEMLQKSSRAQLDNLDQAIRTTRDAVPGEMSLQSEYGGQTRFAGGSGGSGGMMASGSGGTGQGGHAVGEEGMTPAYGSYSALDYDTNPLLSGMGRFKNDDLDDLEKGLINDLRPMVRSGFLYSRQGGEASTTRLSSWGFPNQISMSLTPQVRVRYAFRPGRYFMPDGVSPDSTNAFEFGSGATIKYWDRLTLDGDIALTRFSQSKSTNLTFQAQAQYDFNDYIRAKVGVSRLPQYTSLLTLTGLRPSVGAFRNNLVGQSRENSVYAELNTHPFSQNIDWNLGYSWAFVDGSKTPTNYKNQAFTSLGYTWHYAANHQMRLGYEFLYFGYSKNATNGYFDITSAGNTRPVAKLDPVVLANSNYVFGGYFSPKLFIMNAGRLDFRGSLFNKFLEYKLGGSLGAQTVRLGHGIRESGNDTTLSKAFDANLILNFTDWLAAYGDVDYLTAGGQFNRWRFGGGLIVRPHIDALSPVFGPKPGKPMANTAP